MALSAQLAHISATGQGRNTDPSVRYPRRPGMSRATRDKMRLVRDEDEAIAAVAGSMYYMFANLFDPVNKVYEGAKYTGETAYNVTDMLRRVGVFSIVAYVVIPGAQPLFYRIGELTTDVMGFLQIQPGMNFRWIGGRLFLMTLVAGVLYATLVTPLDQGYTDWSNWWNRSGPPDPLAGPNEAVRKAGDAAAGAASLISAGMSGLASSIGGTVSGFNELLEGVGEAGGPALLAIGLIGVVYLTSR